MTVEVAFEMTSNSANDELKDIPGPLISTRDAFITQDKANRITSAHMKVLDLADKRSVFKAEAAQDDQIRRSIAALLDDLDK